ncbi:DUF2612 domain-containing protein, partial [Salmonella enterica]|uniref:DUF2612 domain-containing protein n=1 Tax=Salmonella enterica TaxID=28901 RepID=UPI000AF40EF8
SRYSVINDFYGLIWSMENAEKDGLDVWGEIDGGKRRLTVKDDLNVLSVSEARMDNPVMDDPRPFNQAPVYSGKSVTRTVDLYDEIYRCLLYTSPSPRDREEYSMPSFVLNKEPLATRAATNDFLLCRLKLFHL